MSSAMISDALVVSSKRPRRLLISFLIRYYSFIVAAFVTLILALSILPYEPIAGLGIIASYWCYMAAKHHARSRVSFRSRYRSKGVQLGRSVLLVLGIASWLAYLYLGTDYLKQSGGEDTLWLLFLLATFIMSQRGSTGLMIGVVFFASLCLVFLSVSVSGEAGMLRLSPALALDVSIKVIWLLLLSFVLHVLTRYLGDLYANVKLINDVQTQLHDAEREIAGFGTAIESKLLDAAVEHIASDFGYEHVNIFSLESDRALKCVAGSCTAGQSLARADFSLKDQQSIIRHVADTGESYVTNNVDRDPHFYRHPAFPESMAELVAPIKVRGETVGVLDIQTHRKGFFLDQDVKVIEILANHIGEIADDVESRQRFHEIIRAISGRFLSRHNLEGTLYEIAQAAHEELGADVVVLYEHDPSTKKVTGPVYAGNPDYPQILAATRLSTDSLVYKLIASGEDYYFHTNISSTPDESIFRPSQYHRDTGRPTFVERERIDARAIIRLLTESDCVGLMFLNFRSRREFSVQSKGTILTFASLAALAVQKMQLLEQRMQSERADLARHLHDQIMSHVYGVTQIIETVAESPDLPTQCHQQLGIAQSRVQDLRRDLKYFNGVLKNTSPEGLYGEVKRLMWLTKATYGTEFALDWDGVDGVIPTPIASQLKLILSEAIHNATRHGRARHIFLRFECVDYRIMLTIKDNGCGFDSSTIASTGGIANMRERTERMHGYFSIDSTLGSGTTISITLPLRS